MIHNFDPRTTYSINGVLWTLAIEEQLYLAYFLLVWVRTKFGWKHAIAMCVTARIGWFALAFFLNKLFGFQLPVLESSSANWCVWMLGAISVEAAFGNRVGLVVGFYYLGRGGEPDGLWLRPVARARLFLSFRGRG